MPAQEHLLQQRYIGCYIVVHLTCGNCVCCSPQRRVSPDRLANIPAVLLSSQEYSDETSKFYWAYGIILGALALLWLAKELIDFVRVKADNKRVDRAGFEVIGVSRSS